MHAAVGTKPRSRAARRHQRWRSVAVSCLAFMLSISAALAQSKLPPLRVVALEDRSAVATGSTLRVPVIRRGDAGEVEIELYASERWRLIRHYPSGYLDVDHRDGTTSTWRRLPLSLEWRRNTYPRLALESQRGLHVIGYDVVANLPSGRRLETVREGFDLYRIVAGTTGQPARIAARLALGGVDTLLYGAVRGSGVDLCGGNRCVSVSAAGKVEQWPLDVLKDDEFVEVSFGPSRTAALVRRLTDEDRGGASPVADRPYRIADIGAQGASLQPVRGGGVPWGLQWRGPNAIGIRLATDVAGYRALLAHDLGRMPFQGVMDFGANNHEGRIAWSQVYYLQGLLSLALDQAPGSAGGLEDYARRRARLEIDLIAELASRDYPFYQARRYSIDREPILSALHLGRISDLFARARTAGIGSALQEQALGVLRQELRTLDRTLEQLGDYEFGERRFRSLGLKRGYPFWADGANAPYNYVSGYVDGLLAAPDPDAVATARTVTRAILALEFSPGYPVTWRYWAGIGDRGWQESDAVSLNTPNWPGNRSAAAHISYRSMDAMALARLQRHDQDAVPESLLAHFRRLTSTGWLLPFVNEELRLAGYEAGLAPHVARHYLRSAAPWEIRAQVAALHEMTPRQSPIVAPQAR